MDMNLEILNELKKLNKKMEVLTNYIIPSPSETKLQFVDDRINYSIGIFKNKTDDIEQMIELKNLLSDLAYYSTFNLSNTEVIHMFDKHIIPMIKKEKNPNQIIKGVRIKMLLTKRAVKINIDNSIEN